MPDSMIPKYGQEEWVTACDKLRVIAPWVGVSAPTRQETCVYNPPPGWVILEHKVTVHSSNNGSRSVQTLAGGSRLLTESALKQAYDAVIDLAMSADNHDAASKLREQYAQHSYERNLYEASDNTLVAKVSAKPHGWFLDRKRGWEEISVRVRLRYVGAPGWQEQLLAQLKAEYGL